MSDGASTRWEPVIGLEIHVQLRTASKLFCRCAARFGAPPNTLVCPVCTGRPGTLPVLNHEALRLGVIGGLALGATIDPVVGFDRKTYSYPDLPKGYQITQIGRPLGRDGRFAFPGAGGRPLEVGIRQVHLEEDAGRTVHPGDEDAWLVDLNRAGTPLLEIVLGPDLHDPEDAVACLKHLRRLLQYAGVGAGDMEAGGLRCDANISLRALDGGEPGTRTEIKNLNSFRHLGGALHAEVVRQAALRDAGETVRRQTMAYDPELRTTHPLRDKEGTDDYRPLPEPDLPALQLDPSWIQSLRAELPELPLDRQRRFVEELGLTSADAEALVSEKDLADYFEEAADATGRPADTASWVRNEVLGLARAQGCPVPELAATPARLSEVVGLVAGGELSRQGGKRLLAALAERPERSARELIDELELVPVRDDAVLRALVLATVAGEPELVRRYRAGKVGLLDALLGSALKASNGQADPKALRALLQQALG